MEGLPKLMPRDGESNKLVNHNNAIDILSNFQSSYNQSVVLDVKLLLIIKRKQFATIIWTP